MKMVQWKSSIFYSPVEGMEYVCKILRNEAFHDSVSNKLWVTVARKVGEKGKCKKKKVGW